MLAVLADPDAERMIISKAAFRSGGRRRYGDLPVNRGILGVERLISRVPVDRKRDLIRQERLVIFRVFAVNRWR